LLVPAGKSANWDINTVGGDLEFRDAPFRSTRSTPASSTLT
jgi:hypothetical protein